MIMKKLILACILFLSMTVFGQTPQGSFHCMMKPGQAMSETDINNNISKANFENYRLLDHRVTLTFDNGFDIVLLSANEAQTLGLINNVSSYQATFLPKFQLPVFHMTADGKIGAAYHANSKYSTDKR